MKWRIEVWFQGEPVGEFECQLVSDVNKVTAGLLKYDYVDADHNHYPSEEIQLRTYQCRK